MIKQLILLTLLGLALAAPKSKIEPRLAKSLRFKNLVNVIVKFDNGHRDIIRGLHSFRFNTRAEKAKHLVAELKSWSQTSQRNAVEMLQHAPQFAYSAVTFTQFYVSNELYVKGATVEVIRQLEGLPEVSSIREERIIRIDDRISPDKGEIIPQAQWNLEIVEAPNAWQLPGGNNGQGVVVANIDTGVRHTHESLRGNFRSDYGWFDPLSHAELPNDPDGHGTHTMATIAGAGVGIAPGAQWITCQACLPTYCTEEGFIACGEWMLCPTRTNGTNPDCSKAPQVISNSWGFAPNYDFYNDILEAWKAVDIVPVFGLGNEGPRCSTTRSPGDQAVIGVGATTVNDTLASFTSFGPAANNVIKPDISAPGHQIYSASSEFDNAYKLLSGTSMATPHVAGAVALLLSRNPNLRYDQVMELLIRNTDTDSLEDSGRICGNLNSTIFPNNQYGHGRLNVRKALEAAINNF